MKIKKAFTLVELIIVIAIIAILSVLSYLEITKRVKISRDTSRTADLTTIEKALNIALVEKSKVPLPDENITISASGDIIGYQGIFGETAKDFIGNISKAPQDGADKIYYTYYVDRTQKYFQLLGFAENKTSYNPNNANAVDYLQRYILTRGNNLGIIVDGSQTPVNQLLTGFDVMTGIVNDTGYTAIFDSNNKLSGTGQTLQWLWSNVNNGGAGYNSPSNCPEGFIPVPGNKDFNQPGFCVAKYEMKQREGSAGSYYINGSIRTQGYNEICTKAMPCSGSDSENIEPVYKLNGKIESKAEGLPIVRINQATAIMACSQIGNGYHLITNNEWMSIARNIENQGINRTGGEVGVGGIYRGKNKFKRGLWADFTGYNDPNSLDCSIGTDIYGKEDDLTFLANGNSKACEVNGRNKRELFLSNGQSIWDLAGNAAEHVNKADNINGSGFNLGQSAFASVTLKLCPWSTTNISCYEINTVVSSDTIDSKKVFPGNQNFDSDEGLGLGIQYTGVANNIFIRGGYGSVGESSGIYSINLNRIGGYATQIVGFRCAR